jgi:hypothetical protein
MGTSSGKFHQAALWVVVILDALHVVGFEPLCVQWRSIFYLLGVGSGEKSSEFWETNECIWWQWRSWVEEWGWVGSAAAPDSRRPRCHSSHLKYFDLCQRQMPTTKFTLVRCNKESRFVVSALQEVKRPSARKEWGNPTDGDSRKCSEDVGPQNGRCQSEFKVGPTC